MNTEQSYEQLEAAKADATREVDSLVTQLTLYRGVVDQIESKQLAFLVDEHFADHPDQLRLEIGDKVIINREFERFKIAAAGHKQAQFQMQNAWPLGEIVEIKTVSVLVGTGEIQTLDKGQVTTCPYSVLESMRRAYLAIHEESQ